MNNIYLRIILIICVGIASLNVSYAQLSMPPVFGDNMVLQRDIPVNLWGKAQPGETIKIKLEQNKVETTADSKGDWRIVIPSLKVGKPLQLIVTSGADKLKFNNILVGEVWVCSGQSNMRWYLKNSLNGTEEIAKSDLPDLRLFNMSSDIHPGGGAFSQEKLERLKSKDYYKIEGWKVSSPQSAEKFSAVAYYFGKYLLDSLKVPVGLIHNAIGGSTTDSWIDRASLKKDPALQLLVDAEHPWPDVEGVNEWVKRRSRENLALWVDKGPELLKNHPFAPGYLYETGIEPLIPFSIKGVIWYQGESNATYPEMHEKLFPLLIRNWRASWGQGDFPFLYVQLPNISSRNRWPEFREGQQRSMTIPNTGMAVIIDSGDPGNVHPKNKTVVGVRLALIALDDVYGYDLVSKGPSLSSYSLKQNILSISFNEAEGLKTKDGQPPKGFSVQGYDKSGRKELIVSPQRISIAGNAILIELPQSISPTKIKYAWSPNPEVNLYNVADLPMAPFKIELPGNN